MHCGARISAQRGAIKAENRGGGVYALGPRPVDFVFGHAQKGRNAVGRAREGAGGGIPPPLATCENE